MNATLEIEGYELVSNGTIFTVPNKKIIFKIGDVVYELIFANNIEFEEHKISFNVMEGTKTMEILFENFNNSLGIANTTPLPVGEFDNNNKTLYFNYRIYSLDKELGKLLHYTWYLGKKEGGNDGK